MRRARRGFEGKPGEVVSCRSEICGSVTYQLRGVSIVKFPRCEFRKGGDEVVKE